jgi:hypothetical protein
MITKLFNKTVRFCKSVFSGKLAFVLLWTTLAYCANAQDITMPTVEIEGIDEDSSADSILVTIFKFVGRIAIWAIMLGAGFVALRSIIKSWISQKQNDEARWGAVIGDSIGHVIMAILIIALGTWVLGFLA